MDPSYLDVNALYLDEAKIQETFLPFSSTSLKISDEVRITIQNTDVLTLFSESFMSIEENLTKPKEILSKVMFEMDCSICLTK